MTTSTLIREEPRVAQLATRTMAVVRTIGDPNMVAGPAIAALYGSVEALRAKLQRDGRDLMLAPLRARWPDAHLVPKERWHGVWGLRVPDDVTEVPQVDAAHPVSVERWHYGACAEMVHRGPFSAEPETIRHLHEFINEQGFVIAGSHEEEYLTMPGADEQIIMIRYPVRKIEHW